MTVPLSTIKAALKIDYADDDAQLIRLREAAWNHIERRTQLSLSVRNHSVFLSSWEDSLLPVHPYAGIVAINYTDATTLSNASLAAADYWIDTTEPMPRVRFINKPAIAPNTAIEVRYSAGFVELPGELTQAIISLVGAWYSNPEALQPTGMTSVPLSLEYIIDSFSVRSMIR